ncbi:hypothetical protein D0Y65_010462 [Glycine soja]|uniref:RIN4 pathogenic type III effector avirulence factor Avr cleavage site domain-containing protein n=1 Tax=Glycine soja TaxID=3848 RepID=A0A445L3P7_GLYSO|nr:hypothetical protein D0Y65_010462 [Glycine soja]
MLQQLCLSSILLSTKPVPNLSLSLSLSRSEITLMEQRKEKNAPWLSVPQFGDWDQKGQVPDYSLDFSKIRETRKQNKTNISRASLGNEEELTASATNNANTVHSDEHQHPHYNQTNSPTVRSLTCFTILILLV